MDSAAERSLTDDEKRAHVQAYLKSNQSRQKYCEQNGLKLSSFKNWPTKYGRKRISNFVPVVPEPQAQAIKTQTPQKPQRIEILKGDCKVVLCDVTNLSMTLEIIKGVLSCN